jgi:hypothetical protein
MTIANPLTSWFTLLALFLATPGWPGGDDSIKAGQDFFLYANGGWLNDHPIPPDLSGFSIATIVSR